MKKAVVIMILLLLNACRTAPPDKAPSPAPITVLSPAATEPARPSSRSIIRTEPPPTATFDLSTPSAEPEAGEDTASAPVDKWSLWTDGPHLRGANIWQAVVVPELDGLEFKGPGPVGPPFVQADFDRLAALGANYVSISGPGLFTETPPYTVDPGVQANLDHLLEMIAQAGMFATIGFRTGPGRSEFSLCCGGEPEFEGFFNDTVWTDPAAQDAWVEMWRYTAQRYRDNPIVVGYKLMVEPNAAGVLLDLYDPDEFYAEYAGTLYDWNQFYPRIVAGIREVDSQTPILVGGMGWSSVAWLPYLKPVDAPRIVYVVHQYEPQDSYTHQESPVNTYPGQFDADEDGQVDQVDRQWLDDLLSTVDEFMAAHHVPMAVDEFGVMRWQPGAAQFMDDQMALFEQRGLNYALWEWSTSWPPFAGEVHAFNFRLGPDPDNRRDTPNALQDVIVKYWARNAIRPSTKPTGRPSPLSNVKRWLYLIDVNLDPETVSQIVDSEYDMVVLDFIPSEVNNTGYPMAEVVDALHNAARPKQVLAYIDIGQAEAYRTYWQSDWQVGNPDWIVGADPDGWADNYPVAFWEDEWQEIWLGEDGYLAAIMEAGFDGVYLDWVEAYSDENVALAAEQAGIDPRQAMVEWVQAIAEFCRARRPGFVVVAQNAAELVKNDDYRQTIDGIAQEHVWFDGGANNHPPGDCPLPRTEAEVDTAAYRDSLSPECRRVYDEFPNSTLHASSEEYLAYLTFARYKGLPVFTVDYALKPENVAWVYQTSRQLGFIPFVGSRALDQYVAPYP
ncbi:MAG: hypothetical protein D6784_00620 [Chloroflexi bacterium]|nr:MAG: hypothetical protein D6784_00620 [Chloroflexota bacterium]